MRSIKLYTPDNSELMGVTSLESKNGNLVIQGQIMGSMPMTAARYDDIVSRPHHASLPYALLPRSINQPS